MGQKELGFQILSFACFYRLVSYKQPNVTAAVNPGTSGLMRKWYTVMGVRGGVRKERNTRRTTRVCTCLYTRVSAVWRSLISPGGAARWLVLICGESHYKDGDETLPQKFVSAVIVGPAEWRLNHRMDLMWRFSQHTLTNSLTRYPEWQLYYCLGSVCLLGCKCAEDELK